MSDRPTPETDSRKAHRNASGYNIDLADLLYMHQLERERDEARELARELRDVLERVINLGHAENCCWLFLNHAECDCGVDDASALINKAKEVLP